MRLPKRQSFQSLKSFWRLPLPHAVTHRDMGTHLSVYGAFRRHDEALALCLHHKPGVSLGDFQRNILHQSHKSKAVDAPGKVVVEAVIRPCVGKTLHHPLHLTVGESAAERHEGYVLAQPCAVHLEEGHSVEGRFTEEHMAHKPVPAVREVGHPCGGGRVGASRLGLVAAHTPDFIAPYLVAVGGSIGKADIEAVEILVAAVWKRGR